MKFKLYSSYKPGGDQPNAINELIQGINNKDPYQVLLGVTGSGKTFTIANVIEKLQMPTLILSHNKTLAAQLYGEFKQFFPENAVNYYVSYYDYYQPEAYIASTNTYIEKDLKINEELEKLGHISASSLMSGRKDVVVVSSISCIYGMGNPNDYSELTYSIKIGDIVTRNNFISKLIEMLYNPMLSEFTRGNFRVIGDTIDIYTPYENFLYRISFYSDEIDEITSIDIENGKTINKFEELTIYPANIFVTSREKIKSAIPEIKHELEQRKLQLLNEKKILEAARLQERVNYDIEIMQELGYCKGIENYSRFFDRRKSGERPFCLLDYFPDKYLTIIDESHVTVPQIKAMYRGDRARKISLVENGFRLPSALDNRPLSFEEFEDITDQTIYVSATPGDYELQQTQGVIIEQIIRPTGLLDPPIEVRQAKTQIDNLIEEIHKTIADGGRILATTLTKRMAEELAKYLSNIGIKTTYMHSEIKTLERVEILRNLRLGEIDVLIGVNLLREGLDLPEVHLVAILDADKEGFLRSERSLIQTIGRAARNSNGRVIMYADKITDSMQKTISETHRRRNRQIQYNKDHNMIPTTVHKTKEQILEQTSVIDAIVNKQNPENLKNRNPELEDLDIKTINSKKTLEQYAKKAKSAMLKAAKDKDFLYAAKLRDIIEAIERAIKEKFNQ